MTDMRATNDTESALQGRRVLILEDEYYLADDLAGALALRSATVVGPISDIAEATRMLEESAFDCAVLDMNLHGEMAFKLAGRLKDEGVPFVIATGYGGASLPDALADVPRVEKPADPAQVVALLMDVVVDARDRRGDDR